MKHLIDTQYQVECKTPFALKHMFCATPELHPVALIQNDYWFTVSESRNQSATSELHLIALGVSASAILPPPLKGGRILHSCTRKDCTR